jgi:hypothetical protein
LQQQKKRKRKKRYYSHPLVVVGVPLPALAFAAAARIPTVLMARLGSRGGRVRVHLLQTTGRDLSP